MIAIGGKPKGEMPERPKGMGMSDESPDDQMQADHDIDEEIKRKVDHLESCIYKIMDALGLEPESKEEDRAEGSEE